jgi:WD40 repeat protein/serine/threonine protein kinase
MPSPHDDAEQRLLAFDQAWQDGLAPCLDNFLAGLAEGPARLDTLNELVKIDLEYRWRHGERDGPRLDEYVQRFPELGPLAAPALDLIAAEYEARRCWGDQPTLDAYAARFPGHGPALQQRLRAVDALLAEESTASSTRVVSAPAPATEAATSPVTAPHTANTLIADIVRLRLLAPEQSNTIAAGQSSAPIEAAALARDLVQRGWLTEFQANQLTLGLAAELRLGSYVLLDFLGEGATGRVYRARDERDGSIVALKVIRKELLAAPEVVARFHREAQLAGRIDHPNLVRAFDADPAGPALILAMEYVEGIDLSHRVKQSGPLPVEQACAYLRQAALALQYAHERGLVHRDVKPSNLMVTPAGQVKLLDLGLARFRRSVDDDTMHTLMDPGLTGTMTPLGSVMMGTPDYMAPEQALDFHKADIRADVYSLGCTFYFLLTGQPPFAGSTLTAKLLQHQQAEPPRLAQFRQDVPTGVLDLLSWMLAKEPQQRPQTPAEVVQGLDAIARHEVVRRPARTEPGLPHSRPTARGRRSQRMVRVIVSALAVAMGLGIMLTVPPPERPTEKEAFPGSLSELQARAASPSSDVGALRRDVVSFRAARPGTPEARAASELLMRLPAPLDGLTAPRIPEHERFAGAPDELIAVLGQRFFRHRGTVETIVLAGRTLFSGGTSDGAVHLWDLDRRTEQAVLRTPAGQVSWLVLSPDGQTLVIGGDNNVHLWDVAMGRERDVLRGHSNTVTRLACSVDGTLLASASADKSIKLWDVPRKQERATLTGHAQPATALIFTLDNHRLISGSQDKTIKVWDVHTGKEHTLSPGHTATVQALACSPDGKLLASGGDENRVLLWDTATWRLRGQLKHGAPVRSLAFTRDGRTLASGGRDGVIKLWNVITERETAALRGHTGTVNALVFERDGRLLISGGNDGTIRLWDTHPRQELFAGHGHAGVVQALAFAPDGSALATAGLDQTIRVWDLATGKQRSLMTGHNGLVVSIAYDPLGQSLATGSHDGTVRFWDAATGGAKGIFPVRVGWAGALAFAPDGGTVTVGCQFGAVKVAEVKPVRERTAYIGHKQAVNGIAYAPDGSCVASASDDGTARVWSVATGQTLASLQSRAVRRVRAVTYAPDGRILAAANVDGTVSLWDVATSKEKTALAGHSGEVLALAYRPDGKVLVTGGSDGRVVFWDPASGTKLQEWLLPSLVQGVAYAPDGRHLATANSNGTVYLFRLGRM